MELRQQVPLLTAKRRNASALIAGSGTFSHVRVSLEAMSELEDLYRTHVGAAMKAAWLISGDAQTADDLVQEAFVKCAGRLAGIRDLAAFGRYRQQAVIRLGANESRRRGYERRLVQVLGAQQAARPWSEPEGRELSSSLSEALAGLPERQRAVLVARFYLDLSEAATAAALGMRLGTVKSTCARGLSALRAAMAEEAI